jgi:predicted nucleic acid-binding protein
MRRIVVSDASCLIILAKIDQLGLLQKNYDEVIVTPEVANEFGENLPGFISIRPSTNIPLQTLLEETLDLGESSAIALANETGDCRVILDDLKARKVAIAMGLNVTGTLGVIASAKQRGIIPAAKPVFDKILETDFRISEKLVQQILERLGE